MKTKDVIEAYNLINKAKLTKMDDKDKFTVIKAIRSLKPIYTAYEDYVKDAQERLKGEEHDEITRLSEEFNKRNIGKQIASLTEQERAQWQRINDYFRRYNSALEELIKEELDKEATPAYDRLTEEAFGKFVASNDLTVEEIIKVEEVMG